MSHNENRITLYSTETFYTHEANDAYHLIEGQALVYIIPWKKNSESAGRRLFLGEVDAGRVIPSFSYRDHEYTDYRFAIIPKSGTLVFEVMEGCSTEVLKKKFSDRMGIYTYAEEGFLDGLVEYYQTETLKDEIYIQRAQKGAPKVAAESLNVIKDVLNENDEAVHVKGTLHVYKAVAYACMKAHINVVDEERLLAINGKDLTVPVIAKESKFICREVVLDADWYRNDCGILICTYNGQTVACTMKKGSGYELYSPELGKPIAVTKKVAGQVEPRAYAISRALPSGTLNKKDIWAFCKHSLSMSDIICVIVLGIVGALIGILLPTLNQKIYDDYIPIGNYSMLMQMCVLIVSFMLGKLFFSLTKSLSEFRISSKVGYDLQNAIYYRVFQLPESFFRKYDSADLAQRLMQFGSVANSITTQIVVTGFGSLFSIVYLVRMFTYSTKLSAISLLMAIGFALLMFFLNTRTLHHEKMIAEYDGDATSKLYQYLSGVDKIRMAGAEERAIYEYLRPYSERQLSIIKKNRIMSVTGVLLEVATFIFSMVLYLVMVKGKIDISTGTFIAFNSAFGTFSASMLQLANAGFSIYGMKPWFERLKPLTATETEDDEGKELITQLDGNIDIEHVTFAYDEGAKNVLNDFSLQIKQGEYVAIVGPSGCGKSTLLKLLLGFEKPRNGRVCYDGRDINNVNKHSLRRQLGVVLQNGKLISGSIYENITITADHPTMQQVNEVIEAVGLKDDIAQMPMGIHTVLSESGGTISGGQQQRILIARAIMSRPKVLFFDEATSALDNITQAKVCENLDKMNMTRIVIAHRLSTIKNCDRILVIQEGRMVEEGNFDQLMKKRGLFYQMACRQLVD